MKSVFSLLCFVLVLQASPADAQIVGRVIKEGVEVVAKKAAGRSAAEASQEGAEQLLKRASSVTIREAGQESVAAAAKGIGSVAIRQSDDAARAIGMHGSAIATPLIQGFGDDGARAISNLSPDNARRMAILADDLAAGGRGPDWMRLLAEKGDIAADWIWKNKGTITIATTATAFLANPEPFLHAGELVASKGIETAGRDVARPLIQDIAATAAPKVAQALTQSATNQAMAVAGSSFQHPWLLLVFGLCLSGGGFIAYRFYVRPWLELLWPH